MNFPASIRSPETSILIVDDNIQYTIVLKTILRGVFGYKTIESVEDPEEAITLLRANPQGYQLMFVDYNFPSGQTGGELLDRLQSEKLLEGKVAFLITSEPTVENQKQAVAAGALGVVAKPFDREALKQQLEKAERWVQSQQAESF